MEMVRHSPVNAIQNYGAHFREAGGGAAFCSGTVPGFVCCRAERPKASGSRGRAMGLTAHFDFFSFQNYDQSEVESQCQENLYQDQSN
jgi:hypothetical protein